MKALRILGALFMLLVLSADAQCQIQSGIMTPVTTRGYDNARTGANLNEKVFTQANVQTKGIRRYFTLPMEGDRNGAESQTLIAASVPVDDGTTRDIAVISAMNNLVYAFDANDSDIIWVKKLAVAVNGSKNIDAWLVNDHWGVLSTGVIDPDTNIWYGVGWTDPNGSYATAKYYIHSLRLKDGSRVVQPVLVQGNSNGINFSSMMRKCRSSLLMTNIGGVKTIFFACGTVSESGTGAAGWIFAYDVATNRISASLADSPGTGGGIWMGGGGLAADKAGNIYAVTGNGAFNGTTSFGESTIRIVYTPPGSSPASLKIVDHWTPFTDTAREGMVAEAQAKFPKLTAKLAGVNAVTADPNNLGRPVNAGHGAMGEMLVPNMAATNFSNWYDEDYGSAGLTLWEWESNCTVLTAGKDGIYYPVNCRNMGNTSLADITSGKNYTQLQSPPIWLTYFPGYANPPSPTNATLLDFLPGGKTRHMHSTPVLFPSVNGPEAIVWGENSPGRAFRINPANGALTYLATTNETASANVVNAPGGMPGGFFTVSANGSTPGTALLWACIPYGDANKGDNGTGVTPGRLVVYDAENFANGIIRLLWDSQQFGISFKFNKFNPPVVSGGKLFVPTYQDQTDVYGLAN